MFYFVREVCCGKNVNLELGDLVLSFCFVFLFLCDFVFFIGYKVGNEDLNGVCVKVF